MSGEITLYQRDDGTAAIEVRLEDDTVWVTQAQLVDLFQSSKANISRHIKNVFQEGELDPEATVRDFRTVRRRGREGMGRALSCCLVGERVVALHAFVKKTQATPERDLKLARRRMKEVRDG